MCNCDYKITNIYAFTGIIGIKINPRLASGMLVTNGYYYSCLYPHFCAFLF